MFLTEAGEAQVCVMCDLCGKRRRHHRRLKREHSGLGKRCFDLSFPPDKVSFESRKSYYWESVKSKESRFCVWPEHRSHCLLDNPPSTKHATFTSDQMNPFIHLICLCHTTHTGTNRISHVIQGAHEGSIFALCMLRNGTLVSGGKDRRLLSWDGSYQQIQAVEVRRGAAVSTVWFTGEDGKNPRDMIPTIPSLAKPSLAYFLPQEELYSIRSTLIHTSRSF